MSSYNSLLFLNMSLIISSHLPLLCQRTCSFPWQPVGGAPLHRSSLIDSDVQHHMGCSLSATVPENWGFKLQGFNMGSVQLSWITVRMLWWFANIGLYWNVQSLNNFGDKTLKLIRLGWPWIAAFLVQMRKTRRVKALYFKSRSVPSGRISLTHEGKQTIRIESKSLD